MEPKTKQMRFLRRREVMRRLGIGSTTLHELRQKDASFPRPFLISPCGKAIGFLETEIDAWQASRVASRDAAE
jgi:prophage regulatory protein